MARPRTPPPPRGTAPPRGAPGAPAVGPAPPLALGPTDRGDVAHAVPSTPPSLGICAAGTAMCHQRASAAPAAADRGLAAAVTAAKALALTAADVLTDP